MILSKVLTRAFGPKSNRSQNPFVKFNIQLTHCINMKEIFSLISQQDLLLSQKTFPLRMIARLLLTTPENINDIDIKTYTSICDNIESNLSNLKSFEVCDVFF